MTWKQSFKNLVWENSSRSFKMLFYRIDSLLGRKFTRIIVSEKYDWRGYNIPKTRLEGIEVNELRRYENWEKFVILENFTSKIFFKFFSRLIFTGSA